MLQNRDIYTHVFEYDGNACHCVSLSKDTFSSVAVHDLDAGEILRLPVREIRECKKIRPVEAADFEFETVSLSRYADDAYSIAEELGIE